MHGGNAGMKEEILMTPSGEWVGVNEIHPPHGQAREGADIGHQQTQQTAASEGEGIRLDDFWALKLKRSVV